MMRTPTAWKWIFGAVLFVLMMAAWSAFTSFDFAAIEEDWATLTLPQAIVIAALLLAFVGGRSAR